MANTIYVTLKVESAGLVRPRKEFRRFNLESLDSLLAFVRRSFRHRFVLRPHYRNPRTFKIVFYEDITGDGVNILDLLNNNEHVEYARP